MRWLTTGMAAKLLGCSKEYFYTLYHHDKNHPAINKVSKTKTLIDVDWFLDKKRTREEMINKAHEYYFKARENFRSDAALGRQIMKDIGYGTQAGWSTFFSTYLWRAQETELLGYRDAPGRVKIFIDWFENYFNKEKTDDKRTDDKKVSDK